MLWHGRRCPEPPAVAPLSAPLRAGRCRRSQHRLVMCLRQPPAIQRQEDYTIKKPRSEYMKTPDQMSVRQLAAQCIFESVHEEFFTTDEQYREGRIQLVAKEGIGGICVFKGNLERTSMMLSELQEASAIPLLVSADFEYGVPMRLDNGTSFPHAMALGVAGDLPRTFRVAQSIAREARAVGVRWNLAPSCDINSNPDNPIINIRSFGATPDIVATHAEAYIAGTQDERVLACAKHFPGHGDTAVDSHISLPVLALDADRLRTFELEPFRRAIAAGVKSVMVGHLAVPALDAMVPATLSPAIVTGLLRTELGFDGIIITDAMDMKAITNSWPGGEAAVLALEAGVDVVLMPENVLQAIDAIEQAVASGRLTRQRLEQSVERLMEARRWCEVQDDGQPKSKKPPFDIDEHRRLALETAEMALRWHGNVDALLPITKYPAIAGFAVVDESTIDAATSFFTYVAQWYEGDCHFAFIDETITDEDLDTLAAGVEDAELILFPVFVRAQAYRGNVGVSPRIVQAAKWLADGRPTLALLFGNPYLRDSFPADVHLSAFSDSEGSLAAAATALAQTP